MTGKKPSVAVVAECPVRTGSRYPVPHQEPCLNRSKAILGDVFGLSQFGVNVATIAPGAWSSHRHWHEKEDEFIYMLEGELLLVDDFGSHTLKPGMCAGFKANSGNAHHLRNMTTQPAVYIEVGARIPGEKVVYSDIDMKAENSTGTYVYTKKDGSPF